MSCPAGPRAEPSPAAHTHRMFCVNRSNITANVYSGQSSGLPSGSLIGTIAPNRFFRWEWEFHFAMGTLYHVLIRNTAGNLQWGFCRDHVIDSNRGLFFSAVKDFQLASFNWNSMSLREFTIQNRASQLRDRLGVLIETLPAGTRIAANSILASAVMGQEWCTFWRVAAVYRNLGIAGVPPQWYWADMGRNEHAFLDTGLPQNTSATSTIRTSLV